MWRRLGAIPLGTALLGLVVTGCANAAPRQTTATPGSPPAAVQGPAVSGPRGGLDAASLTLLSGAYQVVVRSAGLGSSLYRVTTATGLQPEVSRQGSAVTVRLVALPGQHARTRIDVDLNQDVRWTVRLNGGSTYLHVDLRGLDLASLALAAGAYRMDVALGDPHGLVPVVVTGGATTLAVHVPSSASASLHVPGTVRSVNVDGSDHGSVTGATFDVGPGGGGGHYQIDCRAGLSALTLTRG